MIHVSYLSNLLELGSILLWDIHALRLRRCVSIDLIPHKCCNKTMLHFYCQKQTNLNFINHISWLNWSGSNIFDKKGSYFRFYFPADFLIVTSSCMQMKIWAKNTEKRLVFLGKINVILSDCVLTDSLRLSLVSQAGSGGTAEMEWGMRRGERGYCCCVDGTPVVLASFACQRCWRAPRCSSPHRSPAFPRTPPVSGCTRVIQTSNQANNWALKFSQKKRVFLILWLYSLNAQGFWCLPFTVILAVQKQLTFFIIYCYKNRDFQSNTELNPDWRSCSKNIFYYIN